MFCLAAAEEGDGCDKAVLAGQQVLMTTAKLIHVDIGKQRVFSGH